MTTCRRFPSLYSRTYLPPPASSFTNHVRHCLELPPLYIYLYYIPLCHSLYCLYRMYTYVTYWWCWNLFQACIKSPQHSFVFSFLYNLNIHIYMYIYIHTYTNTYLYIYLILFHWNFHSFPGYFKKKIILVILILFNSLFNYVYYTLLYFSLFII